MKILVTGGGGFVGRRLVERLAAQGQLVTAALGVGTVAPKGIPAVPLELTDDASVRGVVQRGWDLVLHLAAVSSVRESRERPSRAWEVNTVGTARLAEAAAVAGARLLVVSTGEVYGAGAGPRPETAPTAPLSPYAASKLGAEIAALEVHRRAGLALVIVRPFPHTGPGQSAQFVVPAFARRIRDAARRGEATVPVGNLDPVRDLLHVDDVVEAYVRLLEVPFDGSIYNVASGVGVSIRSIFERLAEFAGAKVRPVADPSLVRPVDLPELVGDASRLRAATGWSPRYDLNTTLREVLRAQAD
ncbi:MAG: NAD-dependent epimerase/dehydratase family protein [Gemmatimonadales bacterium]